MVTRPTPGTKFLEKSSNVSSESSHYSFSFPIMSNMSNIQKKKKKPRQKHKRRRKCFYKVQSLCYSAELKINSCILQYRYLSMTRTWCKLCGWKNKVEQQRACINISMDSKLPTGHYFPLNLSLYHTVKKKII